MGGTLDDHAACVIQSSDGGYVVAGRTLSNDGDVSGIHGVGKYSDAWIVKLNASDSIEWQKCVGGTGDDQANCITQTFDGGFLIAGYTGSADGDVSEYKGGGLDAWVVKLTSSGVLEWQKCFGGSSEEQFYSIVQDADSGFVAVGYTRSTDGDVKGNSGGIAGWMLKCSSSGAIVWQQVLIGATMESIVRTRDGGFCVAGSANRDTINNMLTGYHGGPWPDAWIAKFRSSGDMEWEKCFGGTAADEAHTVIQTADGGYILAGETGSDDGDVIGHHGITPYRDAWIIKLLPSESTPILEWQRSLGGWDEDIAHSILQTNSGKYIIAGSTCSVDADIIQKHGNVGPADAWIFQLGSTGILEWQECLGGIRNETAISIVAASGGGYVFTGLTDTRDDGDVSGEHSGSGSDVWVVKLNAHSSVTSLSASSDRIRISTFPNPTSNSTNLSFDIFESSRVSIGIYNIMGEKIQDFHESAYEPGHHVLPIELSGFTAGTYFIRLNALGAVKTSCFEIMR
ncbi:MAG: T9SS type A sorting domain-containing protein [Ignavibacteriota bacterium]